MQEYSLDDGAFTPTIGNDNVIPDFTAESIVESDPQYFLDVLESRATTDLYQQAFQVVHGSVPDDTFIKSLPRIASVYDGEYQNTSCARKKCSLQKDPLTLILGASISELIPGLETMPMNHGHRIIKRQRHILHRLVSVTSSILDENLFLKDWRKISKRTKKVAVNIPNQDAPGGVPRQLPPPTTILLPGLIGMAHDMLLYRKALQEGQFTNASTFTLVVREYFDSRPELVPDDRGMRGGTAPKDHLSAAIFDAMMGSCMSMYTWAYISELLGLLQVHIDNKPFRHRLLQQLSNACHMNNVWARDNLRRHIQARTARKCFRRIPTVLDADLNPKVVMKGKPEDLADRGTVLYHLLCLCHVEPILEQVATHMHIVQESSWRGATGRAVLDKSEDPELLAFEYFSSSMVITAHLSDVFPLPSKSKDTEFIDATRTITGFVTLEKPKFDVADIAYPLSKVQTSSTLDDIYERLAKCINPFLSDGCLLAIFATIITGSLQNFSMETLNKPMVFRFISGDAPTIRHARCQPTPEEILRRERELQYFAEKLGLDISAKPPGADKLKDEESGKKKNIITTALPPKQGSEATSPPNNQDANSPTRKETFAQAESFEDKRKSKGEPPTQRQVQQELPTHEDAIRVSSSAAHTFMTLFDKSISRGSLHWASFESAMSELGFRITPNTGSSITFEPPAGAGFGRSITVHRPHGTRIEGFRSMILAKRLEKAFGWDRTTFVAR